MWIIFLIFIVFASMSFFGWLSQTDKWIIKRVLKVYRMVKIYAPNAAKKEQMRLVVTHFYNDNVKKVFGFDNYYGGRGMMGITSEASEVRDFYGEISDIKTLVSMLLNYEKRESDEKKRDLSRGYDPDWLKPMSRSQIRELLIEKMCENEK